MKKESCNCFTCRHRDEPRVVAGYLQGYIDASDWFINWAEKNKIKLGSIADDDLGGIYAQMKCNRDESGCLLEEFPDLENKTDRINEFITNPQDCESIYIEALKRGNKDLVEENQRLKAQLDREIHINRKMKSALEQYAYEGNWDCLFDDKVYGKDPNTNWNADGNGYDLAQEVLKEIDNKE